MQNDQSAQDARKLLVALSSNHPEARSASPFVGMDRPFSPSWADAEQAGLARDRRDAAMRWLVDNNMLEQTSPLNVRRIGGVTMAENHSSTRPPITRKPRRCQADVDLLARFICHANSTHVLQSLWRGLCWSSRRRPRTSGAKGRNLRITITFTARCSESLILGGSCWRRSGRNEGSNKCSLTRSSSRVGVSPSPLRERHRRAYSAARGDVGCSVP